MDICTIQTAQYQLRGFDSIHLASAVIIHHSFQQNFLFACFDDKLASAARAEGVQTFP
jgi:hypothetical protein